MVGDQFDRDGGGVGDFLLRVRAVDGAYQAAEWGLPRSIVEADLKAEHWFMYPGCLVAWVEPTPFENVWVPHLVMNPDRPPRSGWNFMAAWREFQREMVRISRGPGVLVALGLDEQTNQFMLRLGYFWSDQFRAYAFIFGDPDWEKRQALSLVPLCSSEGSTPSSAA